MTIAKGPARLGFVAALLALLLGPALFSATSAHAQNPPATYYGRSHFGRLDQRRHRRHDV